MKRSASKPVPSPGRPDKFPPPLMRFLRGNMGSRSRSRSRSRPSRAASLFSRRKRTAIEAQQEPTSPKVTCIGQVRVRRSSEPKPALKKAASRRKPASGNTRFCYWTGKPPALCHSLHVNWPPGSAFRPRWRKLASLFRCGNIRVRTDSSPKEGSDPNGSATVSGGGSDEGRRRQSSGGEGMCRVPAPPKKGPDPMGSVTVHSECDEEGRHSAVEPPKNAFLLTRCRSVPYTGSRLSGSPGKTGENRGSEAGEEAGLEPLEESDEAAEEAQVSDNVEKPTTVTRRRRTTKEEEEEGVVAVRVLTRSKSGPASVWRERRLEFTLLASSSSTHSVEK